jgi:rhomboid protease GluP
VLDDLRESPATMTLGVLWVFVFVMMQVRQGSFVWSTNPFAIGSIEVTTSHLYGDATSAELMAGQVWRAVTSTFIHYSLLHLLLNLFGLVQLGVIIEEWYGSPQFLAIYLLIGGLGNLLAGLARPWFGILSVVHCGGGSTVVFGLIGLAAVVGWRSKTKEGHELCYLMLAFLVFNMAMGAAFWLFNGVMGVRLPNFDNVAHASGTLLGVVIGLFHRTLVQWSDRPIGRGIGMLGASVLILCMAAQARTSRAEYSAGVERALAQDRWQQANTLRSELIRLEVFYRMARYRAEHGDQPELFGALGLTRLGPNQVAVVPTEPEIRKELKRILERLEPYRSRFDSGPAARPFRRVLALTAEALSQPPSSLKFQEFLTQLTIVAQQVQQDMQAAQAEINESRINK